MTCTPKEDGYFHNSFKDYFYNWFQNFKDLLLAPEPEISYLLSYSICLNSAIKKRGVIIIKTVKLMHNNFLQYLRV